MGSHPTTAMCSLSLWRNVCLWTETSRAGCQFHSRAIHRTRPVTAVPGLMPRISCRPESCRKRNYCGVHCRSRVRFRSLNRITQVKKRSGKPASGACQANRYHRHGLRVETVTLWMKHIHKPHAALLRWRSAQPLGGSQALIWIEWSSAKRKSSMSQKTSAVFLSVLRSGERPICRKEGPGRQPTAVGPIPRSRLQPQADSGVVGSGT